MTKDEPMRGEGYWQKRRVALLKQLEKDEANLYKRLERVYASEIAKLERDIAAYYREYGEDDVIAYRKLLASLSERDRKLLIEQMDEFAEKYPQHAHLLPVRESIYKLNEMEGIQLSMRIQQLRIGAIEEEEVTAHLEKLAQRSANLAAEQMGFGSAFYAVDAAVVKTTVGVAWAQGESFSERIWGNRQKLAAYLADDFAKAIARGASYERIAKDMAGRFENASKRDIRRLVYTEGTYVFNESHAKAHERHFTHYSLSTVTDGRACDQCRDVESRTTSEPVLFEERMTGVNFPPLHPYCRCSYTVLVDRTAKRASTKSGETDNVSSMEQNESLVTISKNPNSLSVSPVVNTKAYHDAFESMPVAKPVAQSAYEHAGRILQKANGTDLEYMVAINARTGVLVADNLGRRAVARKTSFGAQEAEKVMACGEGVITIHNHPASKQPSFRDIVTAARNQHVAASVVIGHDGSVWYMSIDDPEIADLLESVYNKHRDRYADLAEPMAVRDLLAENEAHGMFTWRRLR